MSSQERAAWFRSNRISAESHDAACPSRFLCQGAPERDRRERLKVDREGNLHDIRFGDYYHQAIHHGGGRIA
jgi:hypothetical protein